MSKYKVQEIDAESPVFHGFAVYSDDANYVTSAGFRVRDYGLALAREKAEAECAFLNAKAEKWEVIEVEKDVPSWHRFTIYQKGTSLSVGWFYVKDFGLDLARTEAARLCAMLNERDAKGAA